MRFSDEQKQEMIELLTKLDQKLNNINEQFNITANKIQEIYERRNDNNVKSI